MIHPSRAAYLAGCVCADCHPSAIAYKSGCRCLPCLRKVRRQQKVRRVYGAGSQPADRAARFVRQLSQEGFPVETIAHASGVDRNNLFALVAGNRTRTRHATVAKLSRITRAGIAQVAGPATWVPAVGATRRLQALARIGWHPKDYATAEVKWTTLAAIRDGRSARVQAGNWRFIAGVYERLSMTPGKHDRGRESATRKGWAPPLTWDDDSIDDPAARPQTGEPEPAEKPDHTERQAMYDQGMSDRAIARHEHVSPDTIRYWRIRNHLPSHHDSKTVTPLGQEPDNRYELWQQGLMDIEIAAAVGRHPDVIRRWRGKHGLEARRRAG